MLMIEIIGKLHFGQIPSAINRITIGICNEVYAVSFDTQEVIIRFGLHDKYLKGSHDHIPQLKALGIKVPDILFEDYSKTHVPLSYQIQTKIEGSDLGQVIESLTHVQLKVLAKEIATIFNKIKTIPTNGKYGIIWGGGENELSDTWTERMKIWIDESKERGKKTGVMDTALEAVAEQLFATYRPYFDSVKPITYYGDINSKNVMIHNGIFNGLVDLDGLTQGDPLEAIGRIFLSWYGIPWGAVYTNALMDEMGLDEKQRKIVIMYALLNQISWTCENGIQFNQNTQPIVDKYKEQKDKKVIAALAQELQMLK